MYERPRPILFIAELLVAAVLLGDCAFAQTTIQSMCGSPQLSVGKEVTKPGGLQLRPPPSSSADLPVDDSSEYSFSFPLLLGKPINAAICNGSVWLQRSTTDRATLKVTISKELPKGKKVGNSIKWVRNINEGASVVVDIPRTLSPMTVLSVPLKSAVHLVLRDGTLSVDSLPGDLSAEVFHGDMVVHLDGLNVGDYTVNVPHGSINRSTARQHLWTGHGAGSFSLASDVKDGDLLLR